MSDRLGPPTVSKLLLLLSRPEAVEAVPSPPAAPLVPRRSLHALEEELETLGAVWPLVAPVAAMVASPLAAALGRLEEGDVAGDDGAAELL